MCICVLHVHLNKFRCVYVPLYQVAVVYMGSVRIRRVLSGPCRRAKPTPIEKNSSEPAGSWATPQKKMAACHLSLSVSPSRACERGASPLWQRNRVLAVACARLPVPLQQVSLGLVYSKIQSRLTLQCARKLIYGCCTSSQCSKSAEADLQAAGKQPAALPGGQPRKQGKQIVEF